MSGSAGDEQVENCSAQGVASPPLQETGRSFVRGHAFLLPSRDRDRFVSEVRSMLADFEPRQRFKELLSVAAAVPGLAVILRWARRRAA